MPTLKELETVLFACAPLERAEKWDNCGTLVRFDGAVTGVLCALDITPATVQEAVESGCNVIAAHHPVIFAPLRRIDGESCVAQLIQNRISAICLHTCLDSADHGVSDVLAEALGLQAVRPFLPYGRIGLLPAAMTVPQLAARAKAVLGAQGTYGAADAAQTVRTIAVVSGAGGDCAEAAAAAGADCLFTGEVKYHEALDAEALGMPFVAAGHYETEKLAAQLLAETVSQAFPQLPVVCAQTGRTPFLQF